MMMMKKMKIRKILHKCTNKQEFLEKLKEQMQIILIKKIFNNYKNNHD